MTGPPLPRVREWSAALAAALDRTVERLDTTARGVAEGWPDARGREWADRLALLRREVLRDADDAHALGRTVERLAGDLAVDLAADPADPAPGPVGPRLGGIAAGRVDERRGVTIPQLGDRPGG